MTFVPPPFELRRETPSIADYMRLRAVSGLTPFTEAAARAGLPGTFTAVVVRFEGEAIGMGRVIGDGGLFFQVTDIAVVPAHQAKGIGKAIVEALLDALSHRIAAPAYVSLIADGEASRLYAQFGFEPVAPKSQGMARILQPAPYPSAKDTA